MAIASVGTLGTSVSSTSASTLTITTATNALAAGDFAIFIVVTDNIAGQNGYNTSDHRYISGGTMAGKGEWTRIGLNTFSPTNTAGDGITISTWLFEASAAVATGSTAILTLNGSATDKVASGWKFTKAAGTRIRVFLDQDNLAANPNFNNLTATNFGSLGGSGLTSASRLWLRGMGKEGNSSTANTVTSTWTQMTNNRSRNNASAVSLWGEFKIATSTGESSSPTNALSADTTTMLTVFEEYTPQTSASALRVSFRPSTSTCFSDTAGTVPVTDGQKVACIRDQNGKKLGINGNTTGTEQPVYRAGSGYPYLECNSSRLPSAGLMQLSDANGSFSIVMGVQWDTVDATDRYPIGHGVGFGPQHWMVQGSNAFVGITEYAYTGSGGGAGKYSGVTAGEPVVISSISNATGGGGSSTQSFSDYREAGPTNGFSTGLQTGPAVLTTGSSYEYSPGSFVGRIYGFDIYQGEIATSVRNVAEMNMARLLPTNRPWVSDLTDDFNDNVRDTTKWNLGTLKATAGTSGITVNETNNRLEVTPGQSNGNNYSGYISAAKYNMLGNCACVKMTTSTTLPSNITEGYLAVGQDANNCYMAIITGGSPNGTVFLQQVVTGTASNPATFTYDPALHVHFRLRYDGSYVYLDTADNTAQNPPLPSEWTPRVSALRNGFVSLSNCRVAVGAGTWSSDVSTQPTYYFDNLNVMPQSMTSTLTDTFDDDSTDSSKWTTGNFDQSTGVTTGTTISETGQRVQVTVTPSISTISYNGYISQSYYSLKDDAVFLKPSISTLQSFGGHLQALAVGQDVDNHANINYIGSNLNFQVRVGGAVVTDINLATYSSTTHAWWRIRHESKGDAFLVDCAPSTASNPPLSGEWVNLGIFPRDPRIQVISLKQAFYAGSWSSNASPPTWYFDGFNGSTVGGVTVTYAAQVTNWF